MDTIALPAVSLDPCQPGISLLLARRRSQRTFSDQSLSINDIAQLLWAAQGITNDEGFRTAPSAGAIYPLEVYVAAGRVTGIEAGVYRYLPKRHALTRTLAEDVRGKMSAAALGQDCVRDAPAVMAFTAIIARTRAKYGERAERFVDIEVGCAAENAWLLAIERALACIIIGAFDDDAITDALRLPSGEHPRCLMPIGHPLADQDS